MKIKNKKLKQMLEAKKLGSVDIERRVDDEYMYTYTICSTDAELQKKLKEYSHYPTHVYSFKFSDSSLRWWVDRICVVCWDAIDNYNWAHR
jgi:hypothetical protein